MSEEVRTGFFRKIFSQPLPPAAVDSLREISSHLESISAKLKDLEGDRLAPGPETPEAQLELLRQYAVAIREQKGQGEELLEKMHALPGLVDKVKESIDNQAKLGRRSEEALADFRETLREINAAMTALSRNQLEAYRDATSAFDRQSQKALESLDNSQRESVRSLRRLLEDQFHKLDAVLETTRSTIRLTLVILFLFLGSLGFVIFLQVQLFQAMDQAEPTSSQPADSEPK